MAALSFNVHSATTFALISFIYNMNALRGFFMWGFFFSSSFLESWCFLDVDKTDRPNPINTREGQLPPQQRAHSPWFLNTQTQQSEWKARFHFWPSPPWKMEQNQPGEGLGEERRFCNHFLKFHKYTIFPGQKAKHLWPFLSTSASLVLKGWSAKCSMTGLGTESSL